MQIVNPNDNAPRAGQGSGHQFSDARRRHQQLTRRVHYAREAGLLEAALTARHKAKVADAAKELTDALRSGRVSRAQVEEEQRADTNRLAGWAVATPLPGSPHEDEPDLIRYRMAVRARALEAAMTVALADLTSPTGGYRKPLPATPAAKPWRKGAGYNHSPAQAGGPISRTR